MFRKIDLKSIHIPGRCDFDLDLIRDKVITVGEDLLLHEVNINGLEKIKTIDLPDETYAIAVHPNEDCCCVVGGQSKQVEIIKDYKTDSTFTALKFLGTVNKIAFDSSGRFLAAASEEESIAIFDITNERSYKLQPGHASSSCLNLAFHPDVKYICSTGSDRTLRIYDISRLELDPQVDSGYKFLNSYPLGKKDANLPTEQNFHASWSPSGSKLALPGENILSLLLVDSWVLESIPEISHDKEINLVEWASNAVIITSGLDKKLKVWNIRTKQLLYWTGINDLIHNLKYIKEKNIILCIDRGGNMGMWSDLDLNEHQTLSTNLEEKLFLNEPTKSQIRDLSKNANMKESKEELAAMMLEERAPEVDLKDSGNMDTETKDEKIRDEIDKNEETIMTKKTAKYIKSKADLIIDCSPQNILYSSSTSFFKNRRFLCWSMVGSIALRNDGDYQKIDIEFADKSFHQNLHFPNTNNIVMGAINYRGALLASKGKITSDDEYEDDLDDVNKYSYLIFKNFTYLYEPSNWDIKLPENENADCVCVGGEWCAVATDIHLIRVFSLIGIEILCLAFEKPIVCLAGYENLLVYVYHDSAPILGCQSLKMRIFDVSKNELQEENSIPLTPYSTLTWLGFSEEGMILSQDSMGIIRGYTNGGGWIPVFENPLDFKFWIIGMTDYELIGAKIPKEDIEPSVHPRPLPFSTRIDIPLTKNIVDEEIRKKYKTILSKKLIIQHELYRRDKWFKYRVSREKRNPLYRYSRSIWDDIELTNKEEELEKAVVNLFNDLLMKSMFEPAIIVAKTLMTMNKTLNLAIILCNKLDFGTVEEILKSILREKEAMEKYEKAFGASNNKNNGNTNGRLELIMNMDNNNFSNNMKKKIGLSAHSVQNLRLNPTTLDNINKNMEKTSKADQVRGSDKRNGTDIDWKQKYTLYEHEQDEEEGQDNEEVIQSGEFSEIPFDKPSNRQQIDNPFAVQPRELNESKNIFDELGGKNSLKKRKFVN